jgi:hypothetical protein
MISVDFTALSAALFLLAASFEAFTAVMVQVVVFWVMTPCSVVVGYQRFRVEDGGSKDLRSVHIIPQHYTASQPRRPRFACVVVPATSCQV